MNKLITVILILMPIFCSASGMVVNSSQLDTLVIPFWGADSSGTHVALASGDSISLVVFAPGKAAIYNDSMAYNDGLITKYGLDYNYADRVITLLNGATSIGTYGYVLSVRDTSLQLTTTFRGGFQLLTHSFDSSLNKITDAATNWSYASGNGRTLTSLDEDITTMDLNGTPLGSVVGSVGSVAGGVGGNVAGSVTGNVGGSVASVTGAVGSVTGKVTLVDSSASDISWILEKFDTLFIGLMFKPGSKTFKTISTNNDFLYFCYDADTTDGVWDTLWYRDYIHIGGPAGGSPDTTKVR